MLTFQDIITNLQKYWTQKGCLLLQPYDMEMGAATFNPFVALKTLGDRPWQTCFVQGCRRPSMGDMVKILIGFNIIISSKF